MIPVHPDDVLFFKEVSEAMWRVAKKYDLPLRSITGYPMPEHGMAGRLGDCDSRGDIRLVMRATVNGEWCDAPRTPESVWNTAAHELAHLRHMNHGEAFQDFFDELAAAIKGQQISHRDKIISKIIKMQQSRKSEAELGNAEAAQAFAGMINKMLLEYELKPSDIDYAKASDNDPVVEVRVQKSLYNIEELKNRSAWQENLAMRIASAHLCKILVRPNSNSITFVGVRSHAIVAEYVYGTMVPLVSKMSKQAEVTYWHQTGCGRGIHNKAKGFRAAWIDSFTDRIWERFQEAKKESMADFVKQGGTQETGLIRLNGSLLRAQKYIDDKFSTTARGVRTAAALAHRGGHHADGREAGREAANRIAIGRKGIGASTPSNKLIGG